MLPTCWAYYIHTVTDKTSVIWHSMYYGTIPPIVRPAQQSSSCRYLGPFPLSGEKSYYSCMNRESIVLMGPIVQPAQ